MRLNFYENMNDNEFKMETFSTYVCLLFEVLFISLYAGNKYKFLFIHTTVQTKLIWIQQTVFKNAFCTEKKKTSNLN